MLRCLIVFLLLHLFYFVQPATEITTLGANQTWTVAGSPYQVRNTITLSPNSTLTIHAGVVVEFGCEVRLVINDANLVTNGTSQTPIIFTSSRETVSCRWAGLSLINLTPSSSPGGEVILSGIVFAHIGSVSFPYVIFADTKQTPSAEAPVILTLRNISISQNIARKTLILATVTRLNIIGCTITPGMLF
jgi:hypothetical protein